jgi:pimeloyl-ACP methyl ester carboxylesterase
MPASRTRAAAAVLMLAVLSSGAPVASTRTISLRTEDGVTLWATLYEANRVPAPAVILVHMLTRSRDDWQPVATRLADAGINALAVDLRGHGASGAGPASADGGPDWSRLVLDIRAARLFLAGRPEQVRGSAIGVAGASVGANAAILEGAADPAIKSLALLSADLDYRGLRTAAAMQKFGSRPALLVAASNDPYALRSMRELAGAGGGRRETQTLDGAGHGTAMLSREPNLASSLVDWFQRTLL